MDLYCTCLVCEVLLLLYLMFDFLSVFFLLKPSHPCRKFPPFVRCSVLRHLALGNVKTQSISVLLSHHPLHWRLIRIPSCVCLPHEIFLISMIKASLYASENNQMLSTARSLCVARYPWVLVNTFDRVRSAGSTGA